jgi:uncharacterized glyoxalase superfamily protein PhnB
MPHLFQKLTPNLVVADVSRSIAFYRDILGCEVTATVPDAAPYVFATVQSGSVEIFFNSREAAAAEYPSMGERPIGGTLTLFIEVEDAGALHESLNDRATIVMPLEKKWYGVTEFAIADPDGWVITFAQRTA